MWGRKKLTRRHEAQENWEGVYPQITQITQMKGQWSEVGMWGWISTCGWMNPFPPTAEGVRNQRFCISNPKMNRECGRIAGIPDPGRLCEV